MSKTKFALLSAGLFLVMAGSAGAASITNVEFSNGDVTMQGNAGQSVSGKVRVVVPASEEVEYVEFDVISDNLAPVCVNVNRLQEGTHFVQIPGDVKFPPNTGTYTLQVKTAGIFGGLAAIDCTSNINGTASFGGAVRTVGSNTGTVGTGSSLTDLVASLQAQLAALIANAPWNKPADPAPTQSAKCIQVANKAAAGSYMTTSSANIALQGFLLSEGENIPALAAGAAFGFWGSQTQSALDHFKMVNNCR